MKKQPKSKAKYKAPSWFMNLLGRCRSQGLFCLLEDNGSIDFMDATTGDSLLRWHQDRDSKSPLDGFCYVNEISIKCTPTEAMREAIGIRKRSRLFERHTKDAARAIITQRAAK